MSHALDCRALDSPRYPDAWDLSRCIGCRNRLNSLSPVTRVISTKGLPIAPSAPSLGGDHRSDRGTTRIPPADPPPSGGPRSDHLPPTPKEK